MGRSIYQALQAQDPWVVGSSKAEETLETVLEARSQKSRHSRARLPLKSLREAPSCLSQLLGGGQPALAFPDSWLPHSNLSLCLHMASFSVCIFCVISSSYRDTSHWI